MKNVLGNIVLFGLLATGICRTARSNVHFYPDFAYQGKCTTLGCGSDSAFLQIATLPDLNGGGRIIVTYRLDSGFIYPNIGQHSTAYISDFIPNFAAWAQSQETLNLEGINPRQEMLLTPGLNSEITIRLAGQSSVNEKSFDLRSVPGPALPQILNFPRGELNYRIDRGTDWQIRPLPITSAVIPLTGEGNHPHLSFSLILMPLEQGTDAGKFRAYGYVVLLGKEGQMHSDPLYFVETQQDPHLGNKAFLPFTQAPHSLLLRGIIRDDISSPSPVVFMQSFDPFRASLFWTRLGKIIRWVDLSAADPAPQSCPLGISKFGSLGSSPAWRGIYQNHKSLNRP